MQALLYSADGLTHLTDKTDILNCWAEHYETLFGVAHSVEDTSIDNIHQQPVKPELGQPLSLEEVQTTVKKMKVHKVPGIDGLPVEVYKHGGDQLLEKLTSPLCWKKGVVPGDLRDAVTVSLYKNKGEKSDGSNYRGVTLMSITGRILAHVRLGKLIPAVAQEVFPESQCEFHSNCSTTDMIFNLIQIQEKCQERNTCMALHAAFIDLTKAFNTISREGLWKILAKLGSSPCFLSILQQLHIGQKGQV